MSICSLCNKMYDINSDGTYKRCNCSGVQRLMNAHQRSGTSEGAKIAKQHRSTVRHEQHPNTLLREQSAIVQRKLNAGASAIHAEDQTANTSVQILFEHRNIMTQLDRKIAAAADEIADKMQNRQYSVNAIYTKDAKYSANIHKGTSLFREVFVSVLKAIPIVGGFFAMLADIAKNPLQGIHSGLRMNYGSGWNVMPGSNGVMNPLSTGKKDGTAGYSLEGRTSRFNTNTKQQYEQFESDMNKKVGEETDKLLGADVDANDPTVKGAGIGTTTLGNGLLSAGERAGLTQCRALEAMGALRLAAVKNLSTYDEASWTWPCVSMMIRSMYKDWKARGDALQGRFRSSNGKLMRGKDVKAVFKSAETAASQNSDLYKNVLKHLDDEASNVLSRVGYAVNEHERLVPRYDQACEYRVELTKALFLTYETRVKEKIQDNISSNTRALVLQNGGRSRLSWSEAQDKQADDMLGNYIAKGVATVFSAGLIWLPPKAIYNANTSQESKKYARFMCAIDLFYQVFNAYIDQPLASALMPTENNVRLVALALADAYASAIQYYNNGTNSPEKMRSFFKETLDAFVYNDPGLAVFIETVAIWEKVTGNTPMYFDDYFRDVKVPGLLDFGDGKSRGKKKYHSNGDFYIRNGTYLIESALNTLRQKQVDGNASELLQEFNKHVVANTADEATEVQHAVGGTVLEAAENACKESDTLTDAFQDFESSTKQMLKGDLSLEHQGYMHKTGVMLKLLFEKVTALENRLDNAGQQDAPQVQQSMPVEGAAQAPQQRVDGTTKFNNSSLSNLPYPDK